MDHSTGSSVGDMYKEDREKCVKFLLDFVSDDDEQCHYYAKQLQLIADRKVERLEIKLEDIEQYLDQTLADKIRNNTARYVKVFSEAVDAALPEPTVEFDDSEASGFDIYVYHRKALPLPADGRQTFPPELGRRFTLSFISSPKTKAINIRDVKAAHIGKLVGVRGIVTRVTEVKPLIEVATYTCEQCGSENYQQVMGPAFQPLVECRSSSCTSSARKSALHLQTRASKFVKFQELRIQELAESVPVGHIPRSMKIHVRGDLTRRANPGDIVTVTGIHLPVPYVGFKRGPGLLSDTYLDAQNLIKEKKSYAQTVMGEDLRNQIEDAAMDPNIYNKLSTSIAPEIFGHDDVKKALLLLLVGGLSRTMADGMRIRGDINICLMGDPGVAKSQLLKFISSCAPRGVYTTGKGSSGVGLTAAITRDPFTKEMVLEGGALVLADKGVCCIDEFDKMDDGDRTSIHEVMEQQTISIAKAGITTTLNARSSILAAANPMWGRYNKHRTVNENINLPAALLSRFDLIFLLLDRPSIDDDLRLAQHITHVHQYNRHPELEFDPVDMQFIRNYVSVARRFDPYVPPALTEYLVNSYVTLRQDAAQKQVGGRVDMNYTARSLLAILRLATALARLRFSDEVNEGDVAEAMRLITSCQAQLHEDDDDMTTGKRRSNDKVGTIYRMLTGLEDYQGTEGVRYSDLEQQATSKGFSPEDFEEFIQTYTGLGTIFVDDARTTIRNVSAI